MDLSDFLPAFISESEDNLQTYEDSLVELSNGDADDEVINTAFRAIHSIKGGAGMFDAEPLVALAHTSESVLDLARSGTLSISDDLLDIFFDVKDIIGEYLKQLTNGAISAEPKAEQLIHQLEQHMAAAPSVDASNSTTVSAEPNHSETSQTSNALLMDIELNALSFGFRMEPLLREIDETKTINAIHIDYQGPPFADLNPLELHTNLTIETSPAFSEEDVEELLSFSAGVEGKIIDIGSDADTTDNNLRISEQQNVVSSDSTDTKKPEPSKQDDKKQPIAAKNTELGQLIKVNSLKLDQLVDDVGELISLKIQLGSAMENRSWDDMEIAIKELTKGLNDLRDTALALRLVPLGNTLSRFHRVVREAARATNKEIELEIIGGNTELDRVTVEKLVDPLTHIIRNSCDHGIELPNDRVAVGKVEKGKVTISAKYLGSGVSLKISDDGKGLKKQAILTKAIDRGLIKPEDKLTDRAIYQLIFHAGLSTAEKVTDLSGRGVGMDVVRKNINLLGGDVIVDSVAGEGTVLDIRLPLTTAILNGFSIKIGDATLVVHMDQVLECIRRDELNDGIVQDQDCLLLRGEYVPIVRLSKQLHLAHSKMPEKREALIVKSQLGPIALLADQLLGEIETVVKPLDPILKQSQLFSGIIKLSSGDLGFVLDIHQLLKFSKLSLSNNAEEL
ncbi:MAG: chemotaxis protein CheA [Kangiellaceae bacterium]|jgi:two-component system chemotaxis sensor kinase CheA|nr:chemotaxis protein CheA [Kangiellaceae bacterium]